MRSSHGTGRCRTSPAPTSCPPSYQPTDSLRHSGLDAAPCRGLQEADRALCLDERQVLGCADRPTVRLTLARTRTRTRTRTLATGAPFVVVRCRSRLPVKAAWCSQPVCGFRYADDMLRVSPGPSRARRGTGARKCLPGSVKLGIATSSGLEVGRRTVGASDDRIVEGNTRSPGSPTQTARLLRVVSTSGWSVSVEPRWMA